MVARLISINEQLITIKYLLIVKLLHLMISLRTENVLTDNILILPNKGKIFKGGYIAIIKENRFKNAWADEESIKRFRNKERLFKYLNKHYPQVDIDFEQTCLEN